LGFQTTFLFVFFKDRLGSVFRGQSPRYGRVVDGVCGLIEHMKKGRLKTGSPFSDDVFIWFFLKMIDWVVFFVGKAHATVGLWMGCVVCLNA
jgi:hypothetical protein